MIDKGQRRNSPTLQGRGRGWGLSVDHLDRLHGFAREMRNAPTAPEQKLWSRLSRSQLGGFKFRRQATIGNRIVDFLCPQRGLIIEVDGDTHIDPAADARRDEALGIAGYRVARVTNSDVMTNVDGVLTLVLETLMSLPDRRDIPHPNPSPSGEGLAFER